MVYGIPLEDPSRYTNIAGSHVYLTILDLILLTQFIFYKSFCVCSYLYSFWSFDSCAEILGNIISMLVLARECDWINLG
jgi:hypothetical protein